MEPMVTAARFRVLCKKLEDVEERPHFDRTAFRTPARTFTTLSADGRDANVMLTPEVQDMVVSSRPDVFEKLKGGWGAMGWTRLDLEVVDEPTCAEILREAHMLAAAPKKRKKKTPTKKRSSASKKK
jgi:hypothetical protein